MSRPLRLLFTIPNLVTAGSGRALYEVARRLDRTLVEPAVCVAWRGEGVLDGPERALERLFVDAGLPVVVAPTTVAARPLRSLPGRVRSAARAVGAATRDLAPGGFDLWHSYHYLDDYTEPLVARAAGARWVYTKKNMSWNRRSWWLRSLLAHAIAAQNRDMLERFFVRPPLRAKTTLLPRGVDTERFRPPMPAERAAARAAYGADDAALLIGCVAQLVAVKGHEGLLDAFARLAARVPSSRLLLAGGPLDGDVALRLRERIEALALSERVRLLGRVDDVPRLLRALDVFVLPTRAAGRMEGCPVALLEAMASGVASIGTEVAGSRDVLCADAAGAAEVAESPGLLVPPDDPAALAGALETLLTDRARRLELGAAARRAAEVRYPIAREVERHEQFYRRIAAGS
ncbi:MAG: glycosyltransferase family 4 protein [Acidobacteriota bacterium]